MVDLARFVFFNAADGLGLLAAKGVVVGGGCFADVEGVDCVVGVEGDDDVIVVCKV